MPTDHSSACLVIYAARRMQCTPPSYVSLSLNQSIRPTKLPLVPSASDRWCLLAGQPPALNDTEG